MLVVVLLVLLLVLERVSLLRFQIGILDPPKGVERPELDKKKNTILVDPMGNFIDKNYFQTGVTLPNTSYSFNIEVNT